MMKFFAVTKKLLLISFAIAVFSISTLIGLTWAVHYSTGFSASATGIRCNAKNWSLEIKGLTLTNFPGFLKGSVAKIPYLYLELNPYALLKGAFHLNNLNMHISDFSIRQAAWTEANASIALPPPYFDFLVDRLDLKLDRVTFEDLNLAGTDYVTTHDYKLNLKKTYLLLEDYPEFLERLTRQAKRKAVGNAMKSFDPFGVVEVAEATFNSSKWAAAGMSQLAIGLLGF